MPPEAVKRMVLNHWLWQIEKSAANLAGEENFAI
jgi:hypothetical protein